MDEQLSDPVALADGMRHKGAFALLYAGVWGTPLQDKELVASRQVIKNYLGPLDLPLQLVARVDLASATLGEVLLTRTGTLDLLNWDEQAFRRMLRHIVDSFSFHVELRLTCHEQYRLDRATGWLLGATQHLRAEVPGVYVNDARHTLTISN